MVLMAATRRATVAACDRFDSAVRIAGSLPAGIAGLFVLCRRWAKPIIAHNAHENLLFTSTGRAEVTVLWKSELWVVGSVAPTSAMCSAHVKSVNLSDSQAL